MNSSSSISSHDRILFSAKSLFARKGYENTSTVAIARQAGTSESQLMKHFGSKQGLLAAILDLGWAGIMERVRTVQVNSPSLADKLVAMLETLIVELEHDPELKTLMTLEGRRIRKDKADVCLSQGFLHFSVALEDVMNEMKKAGDLRPGVDVRTMRAAFMGMVDGMILDELACTRSGSSLQSHSAETKRLLEAVISGLTREQFRETRIAG